MTEERRLDCLRELALDRVKHPELFTKLTRLASTMLNCPIALLSIVEAERQWFLGKTGIDLHETPRSASFCSICIDGEGPMLVTDATTDPRFQDNPLVTSAPNIRSYLGIPIRAESGEYLGSLCVISPHPRAFSAENIPSLETLADLAEQSIIAHARTLALTRANASLSELNLLFRQAEEAAHIGSWRVDLRSDTLFWSDETYAIHGVPRDADVNVSNAIDFYVPKDRPLVRQALADALKNNQTFRIEADIRRADGEIRRVRSVGERIDTDGIPESIAGVFIDCTEDHLQTAALKRAAERDRLTGLYNRAVFDRELAKAISQSATSPVTVMLLDLDGFKDVNDTLGHLVGDTVLTSLSERLKKTTADETFVARWGGDEFAFLFPPGALMTEAIQFAEKIVVEVSETITFGDETISIGATCGIAQIEGEGTSEEVVRRADLALYHGKTAGRGSVHCWDQSIEGAQAARQKAIWGLSTALKQGNAYAAYQPIVDMKTKKVVAVEALLRLTDETGEVISAGDIFPALLDPKLSREVSRFMLDQVLVEAADVLDIYGPACRIGINVSEADLRARQDGLDFVQLINRVVAKSVLTPLNVTLEVTETMLLQDDAGHIRGILNELDALGYTIALDDFGTGFSSLTHLRDFPIRKVKIDKEFITSISTDHQSRLIVQAVVQMGQSLGIRTVAEGVETDEQAKFLASIGCTHAQGYRFGKPVAIKELQALRKTAEDRASKARNVA
ncbi:MAG: EAL domain-containing protein [Pseudomonadota bacterium]